MLKKLFSLIQPYTMSPEKWARKNGVKIGKGCAISTRGFSSEGYLIEIGDYVRIAPNTTFFTHGGIWSLRKYYNNPDVDHYGKIKVGNYTSIGENCMIMPGVTIGERCVIGGGSVVTKSIPDGCMVAGNPAKFIGYSEDFYNRVNENKIAHCARLSPSEKKAYLLSLPDSAFEAKPFVKIESKG